ncbi:MAG: PEP-CTERM sorting domain-containing protein [Rhizobiales bacterium]|nr:PEP-CTERM sorting domain-containing protein [Hyphomicrobiales bacterium]
MFGSLRNTVCAGLLGAAVAGAAMAGATTSAAAGVIPYGAGGTYNAASYSFTAAATGNLVAYIVGGFGAGFENELGMLVNGVDRGVYGLNNHGSAMGASIDFGVVNAGDTLVFVLNNLSLGKKAYSDASLNAAYDDPGNTLGGNHIYSTTYDGLNPAFTGVPGGVYVAFEDLPFPGADFNYDDESFVFSNTRVTSAVPEPSTWAMMLIGFAGIAFVTRRNGQRVASAA